MRDEHEIKQELRHWRQQYKWARTHNDYKNHRPMKFAVKTLEWVLEQRELETPQNKLDEDVSISSVEGVDRGGLEDLRNQLVELIDALVVGDRERAVECLYEFDLLYRDCVLEEINPELLKNE